MCSLKTWTNLENYFSEGDFVIGGMFQINQFGEKYTPKFKERNVFIKCLNSSSFYYLRHVLSLVYAVEEINRNPKILPNITLGFHIYDSCSFPLTAIGSLLNTLSGKEDPAPNYSCYKRGRVAAFIGHPLSSLSTAIAQFNTAYGYPQVSYGAQDEALSDKKQFPYFYRTVPNGQAQYDTIIQLLQHFGWTWVGIFSSDEDSEQRASEELRKQLRSKGICVDYLVTPKAIFSSYNDKVIDLMKNSSSSVVIVYSTLIFYSWMLNRKEWRLLSKKVWIITTSMAIYNAVGWNWKPFNGSLYVSFHKGEVPGLKHFLQTATPDKYPNNTFLKNLWTQTFKCSPNGTKKISSYPWCNGRESLGSLDTSLYDVNNFRVTYNIYTAVYAVAHALHDMLRMGEFTDAFSLRNYFQHLKLNKYMRKVHFKTASGDEIYFDENGDAPPRHDILNIFVSPNNSVYKVKVGQFIRTRSHRAQLDINESSILWGPHHSPIPRSVCTESCLPGYRKAVQEGRPLCCYDCIACSEGEISNRTDMNNCIQCPEDQWSNERRDTCIPRSKEFLSYEDPFGATLASVAIFFALVTSGVLGIFLKHRDTPIVRANNRALSFFLLLSLKLSFLCSLLFIAKPLQMTCLLRQSSFGVIFTAAVSSVLAKTVTVAIAFNATKPSSRLRGIVGSRVSSCLILLCVLGEVLICTVWLLHSPPFPDSDTKTESGKMILLCNEGSIFGFYCVLGYIGLLALLSFFVAFAVRKLPDSFNEAQHITFSMLVFCSVWLSFIPAYLSTKGRYMVAVEIFAILASTAGLLGCIFIPKCYILLLRPKWNTKRHLMNRDIYLKK